MKYHITEEDLVRDLYGETNYLEHMGIQSAEACHADVYEAKASLKAAKSFLDTIQLQPSASAVQAILNYSKTSSLETEVG